MESAERTTSTPPTVTVVGAGTGGLTLARILHAHGVRVTVLDGDASAPARTRGGMLDIDHDSGQEALRAAGLDEQFTALVHAGGGAVRLLDRYGVVRMEQEDDGAGGRPEVARPRFRRLLLDGLPSDTVRWGGKVTRVRALGDGRHEVAPADGRPLLTDLLVGADGAWSRVRPLVSSAVPHHTGACFVEFDLVDAGRRHPAAAALVGGAWSPPSVPTGACSPTAGRTAACTSTPC